MVAVAVKGESGVNIEADISGCDNKQGARGGNSAQDLCDHIRQQVGGRESFADKQTHAYGRIQVATGGMSDGKSHGKNGESERQGDSGISDSDARNARGEHGRSASAEDQPESSEKLRECTFTHGHGVAPFPIVCAMGRLCFVEESSYEQRSVAQ